MTVASVGPPRQAGGQSASRDRRSTQPAGEVIRSAHPDGRRHAAARRCENPVDPPMDRVGDLRGEPGRTGPLVDRVGPAGPSGGSRRSERCRSTPAWWPTVRTVARAFSRQNGRRLAAWAAIALAGEARHAGQGYGPAPPVVDPQAAPGGPNVEGDLTVEVVHRPSSAAADPLRRRGAPAPGEEEPWP